MKLIKDLGTRKDKYTKKQRFGLFLCPICNKEKEILTYNGLNNNSCGCVNPKHKMSRTRLYGIWHGMKDRCNNEKLINYKNYGGRGIRVYEEWENNFENFKDWSLLNGYRQGLSIDRIDNDKNYEPNNCRWSTKSEQQRNRRNNRKILFNGEYFFIDDLAIKYNIKRNVLYNRLIIYKWNVNRALNLGVNYA